jgi:hypothetical protein
MFATNADDVGHATFTDILITFFTMFKFGIYFTITIGATTDILSRLCDAVWTNDSAVTKAICRTNTTSVRTGHYGGELLVVIANKGISVGARGGGEETRK